jgi:DMSO/TMAO reductase YedYZ heme-binding membrane subunit
MAILGRVWRNELGSNPIAQTLNQLGLVGLIFLLVALSCTPLRTVRGWKSQMPTDAALIV